ncbi:unnamed protein product [Lota lota]
MSLRVLPGVTAPCTTMEPVVYRGDGTERPQWDRDTEPSCVGNKRPSPQYGSTVAVFVRRQSPGQQMPSSGCSWLG